MSERAVRTRVVKALRSLDAMAVENPALPGTPDVEFIGGWLELKKVDRWPAKGGVLHIPHFTKQQRLWLAKRWARGGYCGLLLQVGREWLLFDGDVAARVVGSADRQQLYDACRIKWGKIPPPKEFERCVCQICPPEKFSLSTASETRSR